MPDRSRREFSRVANRGNAAFGLIALLLVMAIVLYLMFGNMGGTTTLDQVKKGRERGQQVSIDMQAEQLIVGVTQYQLANDKLPRSMEDLEAPAGAYLDPWGQQMRFSCDRDVRAGKSAITIVSAGRDGEFETEDDVVVVRDLPL